MSFAYFCLGVDNGDIWILMMHRNGSIKNRIVLSLTPGFDANLEFQGLFGWSLSWISDLDGDNVPDLAVGAKNIDSNGTNNGAVWILMMNRELLGMILEVLW